MTAEEEHAALLHALRKLWDEFLRYRAERKGNRRWPGWRKFWALDETVAAARRRLED